MRTLRLLVLALLLIPVAAFAQDDADAMLIDAITALDVAHIQGDTDGLRAAQAPFTRALSVDGLTPRQIAASRYYAALADYRIASRLMQSDSDTAADHLDAANDHLDELLDLDDAPEDFKAEANALRSGVYGQLSGLRQMRAMIYGPRAGKAMKAAMEHDAENPRALLIEGTSKLYTPAMFGGDRDAAIVLFERAVASASARASSPVVEPLLPMWGHADAYAFLGIALAQSEQIEPARAAYEAALAAEPDFGWVKHTLLPALDAQ